MPVLWDKLTKKIVNNCEDDICRMFNGRFNDFARNKAVDFFPREIEAEHAKLSDFLHDNVNNGVYKAGFATRHGHTKLPAENYLKRSINWRNAYPKIDICSVIALSKRTGDFFVQLIRFNVVYHGHFKCNLRRIIDYPNLQGYLMDLYQQPGIAETVNFDHIKRHYYMTHTQINPTRIVPIGPVLDLGKPHNRERLS